MDRPNIIVIVSDTLRTAYMGCYGNSDIHTPNLDAFAGGATRFARAYPESLPTIPVRRALHTDRRAYPFRDYRPLNWGTVYLPGWQPMDHDEDTLAENLAYAGYETGFVSNIPHYFNPAYNFERGFWQWEHIRGYSHEDRWRSPHVVSAEQVSRYGDPEKLLRRPHRGAPLHVANRLHVEREEDTPTAQVFGWGERFLEENRGAQPFYLFIDGFAPHEPWEAPIKYYEMYADPDYDGVTHITSGYGPADDYSRAEIDDIIANYSGLVTLMDHWFGRLMDKVDALGLRDSTAVLFISDHGTNFCENPRNVVGKPENAMYPGVVHLPFLVRLPGQHEGRVRDELVHNMDLAATVYDLAGVESTQRQDGQSLMPLLKGTMGWARREYVTCRYGHSLCYVDDKMHVLTDVDGQPQDIFDLESDPACTRNIADEVDDSWFQRAWARLLYDAGGEFPDYRGLPQTDAIGRAKRHLTMEPR
jgi:arylsulfatase A-like enzyme